MSRKPPYHPQHAPKLETLNIVIRWATDGGVTVHASGESPLKRTSLWVIDEAWAEDNPVYGPYDMVSHLVLAVAQDRPNTKERLIFSMNGGLGWVEEELPFPPT